MKNIFKTLAVAVLMLSAVAAFAQTPITRTPPPVQNTSSMRYEVRGNKVYYGRVELRGADSRTFSELGYGYAKDKKNVYMNGNVLQYVDPAYFRLQPQYSSQSRPDAPVVNVGPAPAPVGGHSNVAPEMFARYVVKGSTVYYNGVKVQGARASSFKDLGWGYGVDTFDVYYCGKEINASTSSFKVLEDGYAKNAFDVFYYGKEVKGASASSFKVLGNGYAKDSFNTYYKGKKIDD